MNRDRKDGSNITNPMDPKGSFSDPCSLSYVATDLMNGAADPHAMPLRSFIAEVMEILETRPETVEICVENVKRLRLAVETGKFEKMFQSLNETMARRPH